MFRDHEEKHGRHYVSGFICGYMGFVSQDRCKQHSALLVLVGSGWVADNSTFEPAPVSTVDTGYKHGLAVTWLITEGRRMLAPTIDVHAGGSYVHDPSRSA